MEEEKKRYKEKILNDILIKNNSKEIQIVFPKPVLKKFSNWAKENADNCFWLAIDKLLIEYEQKINVSDQIKLLMDRDDMIAYEIQNIKKELLSMKKQPEKKRRTFGKVEKNE